MLGDVKLWLVAHLGLAKDALHIYVALIVLLGSARLFGWRVGDWRPVALVAVAAALGEVWDIVDCIRFGWRVDLPASWHDLWNTLFWPGVLTLVARGTDLFRPREEVERA